MKKTALLSVSDKNRIVDFARELSKLDYQIIATGNTAKMISSSGIDVTEISSITEFPEIFGGRVKTLHPRIFGGILFRRDNQNDIKEAEENKINSVDIVCVNLYPFVKVAEDTSSDLDKVIENIDIGGPSLIRASAKNYKYVSVLTDPSQYDRFLDELKNGEVSIETKKELAVKAFSHTSFYDTYIANFLEKKFDKPSEHIRFNFKKENELRYGENPHQKAALYGKFKEYFEVFHGKELSYNNILDLVAAVELAEDIGENACVIIKHQNPAGAAKASSSLEAYEKALKCDPVSSFGGIVAFTSTVDEEVANKLNEIFLEVVSAPQFTEGAIEILKKKKNRRLLTQLKSVREDNLTFKNIPGGMIVQNADRITLNEDKLKTVTDKKPSEEELKDLYFAWIVAKHTKSNSIVFAKDQATLGVGAGQMSRIDSVKIAKMKAEEHGLDLKNSVAASDAFFPFPDGLLKIVECGATAVIQPGGSVRDNEVIEAANNNNISMVFTEIRHFKH